MEKGEEGREGVTEHGGGRGRQRENEKGTSQLAGGKVGCSCPFRLCILATVSTHVLQDGACM
jgi:hypothetical protein